MAKSASLDSAVHPFSAARLRRSTSDSCLFMEPSKIASRSSVRKSPRSSADDAMDPDPFTPIKLRQHQCPACSKSIPIPSRGLLRTPSELQLLQDEAVAEYRDYCMYVRIVNGIHRLDGDNRSLANALANAKSIHNIIRARHLPVPDVSSSLQEDDDQFRQNWQVCSDCGTVVDSDDEGIFTMDI
jgi:hypothetical protein